MWWGKKAGLSEAVTWNLQWWWCWECWGWWWYLFCSAVMSTWTSSCATLLALFASDHVATKAMCCNQSQVPQPSCGAWWWRSWLRICIFRPIPTCRSPLLTSSFSLLNILPKMCRFTIFSRVKQNELGIFYTNNIYKFHVWVEVAMSLLSWFCICFTTFATLCITLQIACFEDTIQYEQQSST